jgi:NTE family protein
MRYPKIGLALGAGGARGFAHLGVIKALVDHSIPIDMIAGSSMGALVGCFYACGHEIGQLIKLSKAFRRKHYLDFTVPKMGFISGKRIKNFIRLFMQGKRLEQFHIPVAVIATDLQTGEKVVFTEGPAAETIRASISIPGIFVPEKWDGRILVDGGVADRIPVAVAREMGADIVIGVDVSRLNTTADIQTIYDVIMQSIDILQMEIRAARAVESDIMICPPVEHVNARAFTNIGEIIAIGEEATLIKLPEIAETIKRWPNHR